MNDIVKISIVVVIIIFGFIVVRIMTTPSEVPLEEDPFARQIRGKRVSNTQTITITANYDGYDPSTINIKRNQRVRITVESEDDPHGIAIIDLGLWGDPFIEFTAPDEAMILDFTCALNCERQYSYIEDGKRAYGPNENEPIGLYGVINVE